MTPKTDGAAHLTQAMLGQAPPADRQSVHFEEAGSLVHGRQASSSSLR